MQTPDGPRPSPARRSGLTPPPDPTLRQPRRVNWLVLGAWILLPAVGVLVLAVLASGLLSDHGLVAPAGAAVTTAAPPTYAGLSPTSDLGEVAPPASPTSPPTDTPLVSDADATALAILQ